ncbi:MAG: DUF4870 domain-containing protein [Bacteroidales bacterium]|jgi:uncharacterized membrane protein|nr:DUF4870 domain-containing protein [Bacteroidales bacterium]
MEYQQLPQPSEVSDREREDATGAYLMMFATVAVGLPLPVINMIAAIVYYFVNRSKGNFVKFHSLQSLYSQLPVSILNSTAVIWAIVNLAKEYDFTSTYWGFLIAVGVFNIIYAIFSIIGAVRAHRGRFYYFLFFGKLAYMQVFRTSARQQMPPENKPPKW